MKKLVRFLLRFLFLWILLTAAVFLLLALYYRNSFPVNTWINGIYCTGKTVEGVNRELSAEAETPVVRILDETGDIYLLDMAQTDYMADFTEPLEEFIHRQNPLLWVQNIMLNKSHVMSPKAAFDEDKLRDMIDELEIVQRDQDRSSEVSIYFSEEEGWQLNNGLKSRLNTEVLFEQIVECVADGSYEVGLEQADCIYDVPPTPWQMTVLELWDKVDEFQQCGIVYDMGDQMIPLKGRILGGFLAVDQSGLPILDAEGELVVDTEQVKAFISELAEEYDTYGKEISFQSTRGDIVQVPGNGTYGTAIDQSAEFSYLMEALDNNSEEIHIPAYERQGLARGRNDIGDTYIEVDMTEQKMYCYMEGEPVIETDVVTGNLSWRMSTPEGVYYVYFMQRNRVLRGPGYATPVKYWMAVVGAVGIHDAGWRPEFGGEIYKTDGSHGCVNTPTEVMARLYDMVEVGTPVVMFY